MKTIVLVAALLTAVSGFAAAPSGVPVAQVPSRCLHGPSEQPDQRTRREQALGFAGAKSFRPTAAGTWEQTCQ